MQTRSARRAVLLAFLAAAAVQGQYPVPGDPPPASVSVRVHVPANVAAGTDLTYRIVAENVSRAQAHHVLVKTTLPKGVTLVKATPKEEGESPALSWKFGTLEPGQRREITLVVKPTTDDDLDLCARVQFEHGQCVRTRVSRPGLSVRRTGPATASLNQPVSYRLEVANTGRATAKGVVVEETLPDGLFYLNSKPSTKGDKSPLVWELGDIEPGRTKTIDYDAASKEGGKFTLRTVLRASGLKDQEKTATLDVQSPNLDVLMTGPATRVVGRVARFTITVVNTGTSDLADVKLTDELPSEIVFAGAAGGGRLDGDVVRWDLGRIAAGGRRSVTLDVKATATGSFKNVATASAGRDLREQGKATTEFVAAGPVAVEVEHDGAAVASGKETTVSVKVANTSKEKQEKVPVEVTLPEGLELVEARGPSKHEAAAGKVRFEPIDALEAGAEVTATVRVKAVKEGEHRVRAKAGAAEDEGVVAVRGK